MALAVGLTVGPENVTDREARFSRLGGAERGRGRAGHELFGVRGLGESEACRAGSSKPQPLTTILRRSDHRTAKLLGIRYLAAAAFHDPRR